MADLSPSAVTIRRGEITIDADLLAPNLGLSVAALKNNMSEGLVTHIAEKGMDEDAGRTRLTFRYRARVWRVVIEDDGTIVEDLLATVNPLPTKNHLQRLGSTRNGT